MHLFVVLDWWWSSWGVPVAPVRQRRQWRDWWSTRRRQSWSRRWGCLRL